MHVEPSSEASLAQHSGGVGANAFGPAGFKRVMIIEPERGFGAFDATAVGGDVPIVLALLVEVVEFEQAIGHRDKPCSADLVRDLRIVNRDGRRAHDAWIAEASAFRHADKIGLIQRAAETFGIKNGIVGDCCRQATVNENVADIELTAGPQYAKRFLQHGWLLRAEVNHAVRHHNIDAAIGKANRCEVFNVAAVKCRIGLSVTKARRVPWRGCGGSCQLLGGHVDAMDVAVGANQLGQHIHVATGAAAEVEHGGACQCMRDGKPAAIEAV